MELSNYQLFYKASDFKLPVSGENQPTGAKTYTNTDKELVIKQHDLELSNRCNHSSSSECRLQSANTEDSKGQNDDVIYEELSEGQYDGTQCRYKQSSAGDHEKTCQS